MNEMVDKNTGEIKQAGIEYSKIGLILDDSIEYDVWQDIGDWLKNTEGAIQWYIGDWLNFGERRYGELYSQALDAGANPQTWMDYKWVSGKVKTSLRNEALNFNHHRVVAPLTEEEQIYWLDKADIKTCTRYSRVAR